jgi:hypothetical protein
MTADKQLWRVGVNLRLYQRTVPVGIAADVGNPNVHILAFKAQVFRVGFADVAAIYIAVNAFKRFKRSKFISHLYIAKITGMPNFVAVFKVFKNGIVKVAVGIGYKAYFKHACCIKCKLLYNRPLRSQTGQC